MKNWTIALLLLCVSITGFSQDVRFEVRKLYRKSVKQEKLQTVKTMKDINPGYPSAWIADKDYVSTKISTISNGKELKAVGTNETLSAEQRSLLATIDVFTDIAVEVKYNLKNLGTLDIDVKTMNFSVTAVPEKEAKYCSGEEQMQEYIQKNVIDKLSKNHIEQLQTVTALVGFTVDEQGKTSDIQIVKTSKDKELDDLLIDTIRNMSNWQPAENSKGTNIKQEFEFSIGMVGC